MTAFKLREEYIGTNFGEKTISTSIKKLIRQKFKTDVFFFTLVLFLRYEDLNTAINHM